MHEANVDILDIAREETGGRVVLRLRGELDFVSAPAFDRAIALAARTGGILELDLAALTFVDSTGMRGIIAAKQLCEARSCELVLSRPTEKTRRLFELGRLLEHLPFRGED